MQNRRPGGGEPSGELRRTLSPEVSEADLRRKMRHGGGGMLARPSDADLKGQKTARGMQRPMGNAALPADRSPAVAPTTTGAAGK